jgi:hypothetical protein
LSNYPLALSGSGLSIDVPTKELVITGSPGDYLGIGNTLAKDAIIVNPCFTYEISFDVKMPAADIDFTIGALAFDDTDTPIDFLQIDDGVSINNYGLFEYTISGLSFVPGEWYNVRMLIFGEGTDPLSVEQNMVYPESGFNLKMGADMCKITPQILFDFTGEIRVRNLHIGLANFEYERGFIQSSPFVESMIFNRNQRMTYTQIQDNLRKYFINYHSGLVLVPGDCTINGSEESYYETIVSETWDSASTPPPSLEWIFGDAISGDSNELEDIWPGIPGN